MSQSGSEPAEQEATAGQGECGEPVSLASATRLAAAAAVTVAVELL